MKGNLSWGFVTIDKAVGALFTYRREFSYRGYRGSGFTRPWYLWGPKGTFFQSRI